MAWRLYNSQYLFLPDESNFFKRYEMNFEMRRSQIVATRICGMLFCLTIFVRLSEPLIRVTLLDSLKSTFCCRKVKKRNDKYD